MPEQILFSKSYLLVYPIVELKIRGLLSVAGFDLRYEVKSPIVLLILSMLELRTSNRFYYSLRCSSNIDERFCPVLGTVPSTLLLAGKCPE